MYVVPSEVGVSVDNKLMCDVIMDSSVLERICQEINEIMEKGYEPSIIILWDAYAPRMKDNPRTQVMVSKIMTIPVHLVKYECIKVF